MQIRSFSVTGRGVHVHSAHSDVQPSTTPRNVLEQAAMCDDVADACGLIAVTLKIHSNALALANLSENRRWARLTIDARLKEIAGWLTAECFELMDLIESERIDTRGD